MTKQKIIRLKTLTNELAFALGGQKNNSKLTIETIFKIITKHIIDGDDVAILGFGRFKVRVRAPKSIKGFGHDEIIGLSETKSLVLVNSKRIKKILNKKDSKIV